MSKAGGLSSAVSALSKLVGQLLGAELALLKAETTENAGALAAALVYAIFAVFAGLVGLIFLSVALGFFFIKLGLEPSVAWVVVAALWFIGAAVCGIVARNRLGRMTLFPVRTITQLREDVAVLHQSLTHG
jgi:hypothetical protein